MKSFDTDVLIAGAGAAGLTLGIELARRGTSFRLIDQAPCAFEGSRGKGIQPRTLEMFENMGIVDRIVAAGGLYPPQRLTRDGTTRDEPFMDYRPITPAEPYAGPVMLPQFLTERILRERLAELGHRVEFGRALSAFIQDNDAVTAIVGGETIRCRYLVGCDGGRSFVRRALGIEFPGMTLGIRAVVADLRITGLTDDAWHRWNDGTPEQISLCPLRGTALFQLQAPIPLEGEIDLTAEGLAALFHARTGRTDIAVHDVTWASAYNMNARLADRYAQGRVYLAGDAAHIHPPTGGQGLNTSIQDAVNLGWKLAAVLAGAPPILLDSYEAERRPVAAEVLGLSTRLLDALNQRGDMKRGRETHQLDLGYPDSPLSLPHTFDLRTSSPSVLAGDRAPDAPCRGAGGQPTHLFALFQGTHWTLLGYETEAIILARPGLHIHRTGPRGDIIDDGGHMRDAYGLTSGHWVLVRPDGYVSAVVPSTGPAALENFLLSVGLKPLDAA
jgi:2-polyprenyl-6-methoxyphenol hydroxylase-like FAD-dependent oxidoreductase